MFHKENKILTLIMVDHVKLVLYKNSYCKIVSKKFTRVAYNIT